MNNNSRELIIKTHPFFNLQRTMDSEQCPASFFFWKRKPNSVYSRIYRFSKDFHYKATLTQEGDNLIVNLIPELGKTINNIVLEHAQTLVIHQFRLNDDFDSILEGVKKWNKIYELFNRFPGLWLMQDAYLFERFADSICSQNTSISHLNRMMNCLSQTFGKKISFQDGSQDFFFPEAHELSCVSLLDLKQCGLGYRAKYLLATAKRLSETPIFWQKASIATLPKEDAHKTVQSLPGVGPKVGSLILAFGYGRTDVFAVDVWVMRGLQEILGWSGTPVSLQKRAEESFGKYSAYINNYLFYAMRRNLI